MQKYGLKSEGWNALATWPFADFVFNQPSDWFQNTNKLKQAGYTGMQVDTDKVQLACKLHRKKSKQTKLKGKKREKFAGYTGMQVNTDKVMLFIHLGVLCPETLMPVSTHLDTQGWTQCINY